MFNVRGGTISNRQQTSGKYNGKYLCIDASGNERTIQYNVKIHDTSNHFTTPKIIEKSFDSNLAPNKMYLQCSHEDSIWNFEGKWVKQT